MKYFITEQDIKDNTTVQKNVDATLITPFIGVAQDKHLKKLLGNDLYYALTSYVNLAEPTPNADFDKLLVELKLTHAYWTLVEALPMLYVRISNKGIVSNSDAIDSHQYKMLESSYRSTADHYSDELIKYLEKNAALYPDYKAPKSDSKTKLIAGISFFDN